MIRRSVVMRSRMLGRCSLMTASRPSGSTHAWTWPIDAADSGDSSKWRKICDGAPAEVLADHLAGGLAVERRDLVEAAQRGVGQRRREDARRRRDQLAELHEGRAERPRTRRSCPRRPAVAHEPLRWRVSLPSSALTMQHREGQVDHDHPPQLGDAELVERRRLHVEGRRRADRRRTGPGSGTPRPGAPKSVAGRLGGGLGGRSPPHSDAPPPPACAARSTRQDGPMSTPRIPPLPPEGRDPRTEELLDRAPRARRRPSSTSSPPSPTTPRLLKRWSAFGGVLLYARHAAAPASASC